MSGLFSCIGGKNPLKRSKKKKHGKEPEDRKNKKKSETVEEKEEERHEAAPTLEENKEPPATELKVNIEEATKKETTVDSADGINQDSKEPVSPLIKELQEKFLKMDKQKTEGEDSQEGHLDSKSVDKGQDGESGKHNLPKNFAKNVPTGAAHESDTELCLLRTRVSQIEKENEQYRDVIEQLKEKEKMIQREADESRRQTEMLKDEYEEVRMQKEALSDELEQCKKENAARLERDELDGCHGGSCQLGKGIGNEDTKGTEEILEAIGQLERVCSAFEPGIEKVEKIEMADSEADSEAEKLKTRLTKVEDARSELGEDIMKNLRVLQELECRIIAIEVTKDSEDVTGNAITDNVVKRLSNAEENQTALTEEVGKLTHSYSDMEMRLVQIEEEKDHLNAQVQSALADNEQLRQTIENMSESLKQKEIALQGAIKDSTERNEEVDLLKSQCQTKDSELKDRLKSYEDLKATLDEDRRKHKDLLEKYEKVDKELKTRKETSTVSNEELESLKSQFQNKEVEIAEEQKRSQKELSEHCLKYDDLLERYHKLQSQMKNGESFAEVAATNGVECSTPSQIGERYITVLYQEKWKAAYEKLTSVCKRDEKKSLQILMDFCTEAYLHCRRTARQQIDMLWSLLTNPSSTHLRGGLSRRTSASKLPSADSIPESLKTLVMDFRKNPSKQFVDNLYDDFLTQLDFEKSRHLRNVHERDVNEIAPYINKCLEVSWEMVVQDPPMYLQFKVRHGSDVDTTKFDFYGHTGHKTDYLVWPALLRDENGPLLQKGVIQAVAEKP